MTMRSLEICTQRIFNNLIKWNQRLDSSSILKWSSETVPSVLKQWKTVFWNSVQCPEPSVQKVASRVQSSVTRVQRPELSVQHLRLKYRNSCMLFFRGLPEKSHLSRFPVLINCSIWSSNLFSASSCFPRFS